MIPEARVAQPVTESEAARLAREVFILDVSAKLLPGEYDDNFHLTSVDGRESVLKIMHPAREQSFVEMQCKALQHLATRAPHLLLPRVCPTPNNDAFTVATLDDGTKRLLWLLTYVSGTVLAKVNPHTRELLHSLGQFLGEMDAALADFSHPAAHRELKWDLARASWTRNYLHQIGDFSRRALVEKFLALYESGVVPALPSLRRSVIYGDANDYNVLVSAPWPQSRKVVSVIDFGDMHDSLTVSEVAIAAAYAMLGKKDPLQAASAVVAGYHKAFPLQEAEISVLYPLIGMRLAVSVTNSAHRKSLVPDDPYVTISEAPAWELLEKLAAVHPRFAHYTFRDACGLPAVPQSEKVRRWLASNARSAASILQPDLRTAPSVVFDLSVGSTFLGADPSASETQNLEEAVFRKMKSANASVGIGQYNEARLLYTSPLFGASENPTDERRTIHLGMDLFAAPGTPIHTPLDGVVHAVAINTAPLDYGPLAILRHTTSDGLEFFTLYGHLERDTFDTLQPGQRIARGKQFARIGDVGENGGWAPHLHFQVIIDLLEHRSDFPGVTRASQRNPSASRRPSRLSHKLFPPAATCSEKISAFRMTSR
jgi:Ser/Thr protein kinase RdoA (MazF antagonist)